MESSIFLKRHIIQNRIRQVGINVEVNPAIIALQRVIMKQYELYQQQMRSQDLEISVPG